jgi:hypothetical protein
MVQNLVVVVDDPKAHASLQDQQVPLVIEFLGTVLEFLGMVHQTLVVDHTHEQVLFGQCWIQIDQKHLA